MDGRPKVRRPLRRTIERNLAEAELFIAGLEQRIAQLEIELRAARGRGNELFERMAYAENARRRVIDGFRNLHGYMAEAIQKAERNELE